MYTTVYIHVHVQYVMTNFPVGDKISGEGGGGKCLPPYEILIVHVQTYYKIHLHARLLLAWSKKRPNHTFMSFTDLLPVLTAHYYIKVHVNIHTHHELQCTCTVHPHTCTVCIYNVHVHTEYMYMCTINTKYIRTCTCRF